jgi:outer membrane translocation and assembly module TamA
MDVSGEFYAPADLTPGKDPRCPLDRKMQGGSQSRYGYGREKISLPYSYQESNTSPPPRSLVTTMTELRRLVLLK